MSPPADPEIADPFGGSLKLYEACRDEMVEAIPSLVDFLKNMPLEITMARLSIAVYLIPIPWGSGSIGPGLRTCS